MSFIVSKRRASVSLSLIKAEKSVERNAKKALAKISEILLFFDFKSGFREKKTS